MQPPESGRPLLACIDGSAYSRPVCDFAAWLGGVMEAPIRLLYVQEPGARAPAAPPVNAVLDYFRDNGIAEVEVIVESGDFCKVAAGLAAEHSLIVMGKRGVSGADERARLGSNVEPIIRSAACPTLLAPALFMPVTRALVLLNADPEHRRATLYVRSQAWLQRLALDVVVMTDETADGAKLAWAREMLAETGADVFAMPSGGPDHALGEYRKRQPTDLLVMSREIALGAGSSPGDELTKDAVWAWRAPVLVC